MHEKINKTSENTVEGANKSAFNALAQMKDKFNPDKARQLIELEESSNIIDSSSNTKQENAAHVILEEDEKPENSNNIVEQSTLDVIPQSKEKTQRRLTLSDKYDIKERPRVDRLKSNLYSDSVKITEYERKQSASEPSILKKAVRLITDKLGMKTKRGEELRDREAMRIALTEYREEDARRRAYEERERKVILEKERREAAKKAAQEAAQEADKARQEREDLEETMLLARDRFDLKERFKKQRVQEIVERDLNARLLTTDNLETEVLSENPEIQKQSVLFDGVQIPVYDLKGLSFSILSTTVDYRKPNDTMNGSLFDIGKETYKKVLANPAIWGERREDAEKFDGFGTRNRNARGDTICTSYWNSDRNIYSHVTGDLIYGFERVGPDSIISVFNRDGGTGNMDGRNETDLSDPDEIRNLEGADGNFGYNEILLRRYSENGIPKKPDYIITENDKITEAALRHAKYFGIPIVNIDRASYTAKAEKKGEEIINSISEKDNYLDLDNKLKELLSIAEYKAYFHQLENVGRNFDTTFISPDADPIKKQCLEIAKIEQLKRIDFIKTTLEEAIDKIKMDKRGKMDLSQVFSQFALFDISIQDVHNQTRSTVYHDEENSFYSSPGNCNFINVEFRLKGSSRTVKTTIYDGERVFDGERILSVDEALAKGVRTKEYFKNADSSFYDTIEPLAREYFDEFRRNQG
ncbi:hypothetical protein JEO88_03585 [Candidatus Saccharibacteria bacterium]|nr:hypothetical protein [Candidatus Saccharibacteria bacterium]